MPLPVKALRQASILVHRYLGIPFSLLFVTWFASGVVMMYTGGMPADSADERLARLGSIRFDRVRLSPAEAARAGDIRPAAAVLSQIAGRPAWRFRDDATREVTVYADDGSRFGGATPGTGVDILSRAFGSGPGAIEYVGTITSPDQWTLTERRRLPLLVYRIDDAAGTQAYVASATGEIVLALTRAERWLAWAGAIPHWFYVTPLRRHQPAWYWTVVVVSTIGCVVALLGLVLAVTQFRRSSPFSFRDSVRYRGLMRWHFFSGAVFGGFALTWIFSGLLSMQPFDWMQRAPLPVHRDTLAGGPLGIDGFPAFGASAGTALDAGGPIAEVELLRVEGRPRLLLRRNGGLAAEQMVDAISLQVVDTSMAVQEIIKLTEAATGVRVTDHALLRTHDAYYYGRDDALPVLRLRLDDPRETWLYIDPRTGRLRLQNQHGSRLGRWLFNGLHSLDFPFLYHRRPLWDVVVIMLSLGGLAISGLGLVLGAQRISRAIHTARRR